MIANSEFVIAAYAITGGALLLYCGLLWYKLSALADKTETTRT